MSVVTEFTVPAGAFALEHTFETVPDVAVEIERLATHSREWVMPFLWATADDVETVATTLREDPSTADVRLLDTDAGTGHFNVHWAEDVQRLIDQIVDRHGTVKEAHAVDGTWNLTIQFVGQDILEEFRSYFHERGYSFELERMYTGIAPREREYDLTPEQREALVTGLAMGYFSVPRDAQIGDLAAELGVSTNAVSERLRRATANLTRSTLTVSQPSTVPGTD